ncbi:MAG: ACT domain-containing protein [Pseudomonadota bacterium]
MSGEKDLDSLLASLSPEFMEGEFVFCSFPGARYGQQRELEPVAVVVEREGLTLIIPRSRADAHGHDYESVFRGITLHVHSSLDAVGLTAAVSRALTVQGISANVVAGYHHDHLFVPARFADRAMAVLRSLSD